MGILGVSGLGFSWKVSRDRVPNAERNGEEEEEGDQEEEKEKEEEEEEEEERSMLEVTGAILRYL